MNAIERKAWVSELEAAIADFARGFERISWMLEALNVEDSRERDRLSSLTFDVRMRLTPVQAQLLHYAREAVREAVDGQSARH